MGRVSDGSTIEAPGDDVLDVLHDVEALPVAVSDHRHVEAPPGEDIC